MIVSHHMTDLAFPRSLTASVERALRAMPVVVVTGARHSEKSTLARHLLSSDRQYLTLDDLDLLELATGRPGELAPRRTGETR